MSQHGHLDSFGVQEYVTGLLFEDSRDAIEKVALKTQCQRRLGVGDALAGLGYVYILDSPLGDLALGTFAGCGNHPGTGSEPSLFTWEARGKHVPDRGHAILSTGKYCAMVSAQNFCELHARRNSLSWL